MTLLVVLIAASLFLYCLPLRDSSNDDELHFGVVQDVVYGIHNPGIQGAQWTGIVTGIAVKMLETGAVDAVVCVQSDPDDR